MDSLAKHAEEAIGAGAANAADKKGTFAVKVPRPFLLQSPARKSRRAVERFRVGGFPNSVRVPKSAL